MGTPDDRTGNAEKTAAGQGVPPTPRLASTVLLMRDSVHGIELYVQERVSTMKFAANMTMFPGGGVDARDFPGDVDGDGHDSPTLRWSGHSPEWWAEKFHVTPATARALVCAAVRETFEETGTLLAEDADGRPVADSSNYHAQRKALESKELAFSDFMHDENLGVRSDLVRPWGNWVTPESFPVRFDTFFFVAAQPEGQIADGDTSEASSTGWFRPMTLLDGWRDGKVGLMPPTSPRSAAPATTSSARRSWTSTSPSPPTWATSARRPPPRQRRPPGQRRPRGPTGPPGEPVRR